jgi:hypothetical protein
MAEKAAPQTQKMAARRGDFCFAMAPFVIRIAALWGRVPHREDILLEKKLCRQRISALSGLP